MGCYRDGVAKAFGAPDHRPNESASEKQAARLARPHDLQVSAGVRGTGSTISRGQCLDGLRQPERRETFVPGGVNEFMNTKRLIKNLELKIAFHRENQNDPYNIGTRP